MAAKVTLTAQKDGRNRLLIIGEPHALAAVQQLLLDAAAAESEEQAGAAVWMYQASADDGVLIMQHPAVG